MVSLAHMNTMLTTARRAVVVNQKIVRVNGVPTVVVLMSKRDTRTSAAEPTRLQLLLVLEESYVHTRMKKLNALPTVAASQWIVLEPGAHMELASMTRKTIRTEDAELMISALALPTMALDVHM